MQGVHNPINEIVYEYIHRDLFKYVLLDLRTVTYDISFCMDAHVIPKIGIYRCKFCKKRWTFDAVCCSLVICFKKRFVNA